MTKPILSTDITLNGGFLIPTAIALTVGNIPVIVHGDVVFEPTGHYIPGVCATCGPATGDIIATGNFTVGGVKAAQDGDIIICTPGPNSTVVSTTSLVS